MAFADLTNDFVFRRIFATHPDILRGLLNDLLDRQGHQAIDTIEYLPSEQLPLVMGAKLSILDVRCKDREGTTFVVEMQLIHHPGFINRVVDNACKAYVGQLKAGAWYDSLTNVVAISICDFELWPDKAQEAQGLKAVPMLSRWAVTENSSKSHTLQHVQYAFLELPKLPERKPDTGALQWAWLFVHAPELTEIPADLPAPYREALELANQAKFTQAELDAYEKVRDEIRQVLAVADAGWAEGNAEGKAEGKAEGEAAGFAKGEAVGLARGKAVAVLAILAARSIHMSPEARALIEGCEDTVILDQWIAQATTAASAEEIIAAASPSHP